MTTINYNKETPFQAFYHSCFGKFVILAVFIGALMVLAIATVPSTEKMEREMADNIRQCIQENDSIQGDAIDDAIGNIGRIFTEADSTADDKELMETFYKYNRVEIVRHTMYATARLYNNFRPEGVRVGIGMFGVVIPTVNFNDFLMRVGPVRRTYNRDRLIEPTYDDYVGDNPNVREYHYQGDPDQ